MIPIRENINNEEVDGFLGLRYIECMDTTILLLLVLPGLTVLTDKLVDLMMGDA